MYEIYGYLNDDLIEINEGMVSINDRALQFGDGIYEVIRIYEGQYFMLDEHLDRFESSAASVRFTLPFSREELVQKLRTLLNKNEFSRDGIVYMQLSRGVSIRNHLFPDKGTPLSFIAYVKQLDRPLEQLRKGVKTSLENDFRWLRCDIKSLNLLPNVMAKQAAHDQGCYEAILYRNFNHVTEGCQSNLFIVKNSTIITHPINELILSGITRNKTISVAEANGIRVKEVVFSVQELKNADEVFLTSTTSEVMPIIYAGGTVISRGTPGPITMSLQRLYEEAFRDIK
jgi:D-alanine transaminase